MMDGHVEVLSAFQQLRLKFSKTAKMLTAGTLTLTLNKKNCLDDLEMMYLAILRFFHLNFYVSYSRIMHKKEKLDFATPSRIN